MFNVAPDGRVLTPEDESVLRDMAFDAVYDGDFEAAHRLTRFRLAPLPTSEPPPAWHADLEVRFARTGTFN
jgi:hypothetical protein